MSRDLRGPGGLLFKIEQRVDFSHLLFDYTWKGQSIPPRVLLATSIASKHASQPPHLY